MTENYKSMTTEELRFRLWANLQDNLRRGEKEDIALSRGGSEEYLRQLRQNIRETEQEIVAIRSELRERG